MVAYTRNLIPSSRNPTQTPHELLLGQKPWIAHLRAFGCKAHVLVPGDTRTKTREMIFIGYFEHSRAWKLYDPVDKKFVKSRDVVFEEGRVVEHLRSPDFSNNDDDVEVLPVKVPHPAPAPSVPTPLDQENPLTRELSPLTELSETPEEQVINPQTTIGSINPNHATDQIHEWNDPGSNSYGLGVRSRVNMLT
jgi:hypothetical protein